MICTECGARGLARGLCAKHYFRRRRAGTLPPLIREQVVAAASMLDLNLSLNVTAVEMSAWRPELIARFFAGVAQAVDTVRIARQEAS